MSNAIPLCRICGKHEVGTWANGSVNYCSEACEIYAALTESSSAFPLTPAEIARIQVM